jgi:hypothetical protein
MNTETNKTPSRRKFIFLGLSAAAFFSIFKFALPAKKKNTVKMLTQDGKLVEIDKDLLAGKKEKIKDKEILTWVKNKNSKTNDK